MITGRGYAISVNGLSTGTTDDANLGAIVAATDKIAVVTSVQGHFSDGDSAENVSMALIRASASTAGSAVTPRPMNPDDTAAGFTFSTSPTSVTLSPTEPLAAFGGNGAANFGWYPTAEESQIILKPADILILRLVIAPVSALTLRLTINVTEV